MSPSPGYCQALFTHMAPRLPAKNNGRHINAVALFVGAIRGERWSPRRGGIRSILPTRHDCCLTCRWLRHIATVTAGENVNNTLLTLAKAVGCSIMATATTVVCLPTGVVDINGYTATASRRTTSVMLVGHTVGTKHGRQRWSRGHGQCQPG